LFYTNKRKIKKGVMMFKINLITSRHISRQSVGIILSCALLMLFQGCWGRRQPQRYTVEKSFMIPMPKEKEEPTTRIAPAMPFGQPADQSINTMQPTQSSYENYVMPTSMQEPAHAQESAPRAQTNEQYMAMNTTNPPQIAQQQTEVQMPVLQTPEPPKKRTPNVLNPTARYSLTNPGEIDFEVHNVTGKTMYVTCFSYIKKRDFARWRWDKSPIYLIQNNQTVVIDIDTIPDEQDRAKTFGYLAVFNDQKSAEDATYELLDDRSTLDLDQLAQLKGKRVTIEVEKYGVRGEFLDYDFIAKKKAEQAIAPELDFSVENKTGKTIFATCFVYEKKAKGSWVAALEDKDDMSAWRFDKTPIIKLAPGQTDIINVDTITSNRDRSYVRGYLAVFDENEEQLAQDSVYELLDSRYKLHLGELPRLKNKKVVIDVEKYGVAEDFFDFTIKESRKIDFTKIGKK
jgi:hypothetical protein